MADKPVIAEVIHHDFGECLQDLNIPTREKLFAFKQAYWLLKSQQLRGNHKWVTYQRVADEIGVHVNTAYKWKQLYPWFDEWLKTPETKHESRLQIIWDKTYKALMKKLDRDMLDARELIVLLKDIGSQLNTNNEEEKHVTTTDIVKGLLDGIQSSGSKSLESGSARAGRREGNSSEAGVAGSENLGDEGHLQLPPGWTSTDGGTDGERG